MRTGTRVAIIGGSLAGLITARLLTHHGFEVAVYERVPDSLSGRGAGIGTHPEMFDVLREAGISDASDVGVPVELRRMFGLDGAVTHELGYPQVLAHWDEIYRLLRSGLDEAAYRSGLQMVGFSQDADGVKIEFNDGSDEGADVLVGADGIRSTTRGLLFPQIQPAYVGYVAWRGVVPEERLPQQVRDQMFEHFCFGLPKGEQIAGYPIRRAGGVGRDYNIIWYRPADAEELADLLTDDNGVRHENNIPPPLIAERHRQKVQDDAARVLPPQFAEAVALADGMFVQPIYDVETEAMSVGRVALVGDAAFVARPHVGAGVTKGFGDAMALCNALLGQDSVSVALETYNRERMPIGRKIVARARQLGAYMQASRGTPEEEEAAERHRDPEAVIRETASMHFMQQQS